MPATSQSQQRFFGMVLAAKRGKLPNASPEVQRAAGTMSEQDVKDFAATKHKGLPKRVKAANDIDEDATLAAMQDVPASPADVVGTDLVSNIPTATLQRDFLVKLLARHGQPVAKAAFITRGPQPKASPSPLSKPSGDNFQHPPAIGQRKQPQPVPPATADAQKMVMRAAPSVPNPIVPPQQSAMPLPGAKMAGCGTAPRYTAKGAKGKKPMPERYARRLQSVNMAEKSAFAIGRQLAEKRANGMLRAGIGAGLGGLVGHQLAAPHLAKMLSLSNMQMPGGLNNFGGPPGPSTPGGAAGANAIGAGMGAAGMGAAGPGATALGGKAMGGAQQQPDNMQLAQLLAGIGGAGLGGIAGYMSGGGEEEPQPRQRPQGSGMSGLLGGQMLGHSFEDDDKDMTTAMMANG